jgi:hypothetical protein
MSVRHKETHKVSAWVSGNKLYYSFPIVTAFTELDLVEFCSDAVHVALC